MPRIPVLQAQTRPGVPALPRPTAATVGAPAFEALAGFGESLQKVAQTLQAEQDKLDLAEDVGWFEGKVKETRLALSFDPDFRTHPQKFAEAVKGFEAEVAQRPRSAAVRTAFRAHLAKRLPDETVNVQADALKLWTSHQRAALDAQEERLSQAAAEAPSPEARDDAIALYEGLLAGQVQARILTPEAGEQKRQTFRQKAGEKHMEVVARTNPTALFRLEGEGAFAMVDPVKRERIIAGTIQRLDKEQRDRERDAKAASEALRGVLLDRHLRGDLTVDDVLAVGPRDLGGDGTLIGEDFRVMRELVQRRVEAVGVDDPAIVQAVRRDLVRGRATVEGVLRLAGQGLSQATANDLAAKVKDTQRTDHPSKDPEWGYFRTLLVQQVTGRGGIEALIEAKLTDDERARLDRAMDQYWIRTVDKRQAPREAYQHILDDVVGRAPAKLPAMPRPRYASPTDLDLAVDRGLIVKGSPEYLEEGRRLKAIEDAALARGEPSPFIKSPSVTPSPTPKRGGLLPTQER